jgi:hypothetical protein
MLLWVMILKCKNSDFHEKIKKIRNEDNIAINVNSSYEYRINEK